MKRYPTADTANVPIASAGPAVTAVAAPVLELAGPGAGAASDAVATPTSDEATTAAAAARILSLRVAAISLASFSIGLGARDMGRRRGGARN